MDYSSLVQKIKPSVALVLKYTGERDAAGQELFYPASGFVYAEKGKLATCNHVVEGATKVEIKFSDATSTIPATIHKQDPNNDVAILNFSDDARESLLAIDPSNIKEGMPVLFCGYPINLGLFMSHQGIISTIGKDPFGNPMYGIDGSNNQGNSGGPLLDISGKVVGVMSNKALHDGDSLLDEISKLPSGSVSLHGKDLVTLLKRLIANIQLGIGWARSATHLNPLLK